MSPADLAFHTEAARFPGNVWSFEMVDRDRLAAEATAGIDEIRHSGLFETEYYLRANTDLAEAGLDPVRHYHEIGWQQGRRPNPYFDPAWYIGAHLDVREMAADPLLHYIRYGEREGRRPILYFDPAWYKTAHDVPEGMLCLAHFLPRRTTGEASPLPEFDSAWYLRTYPDIAQAGMDPLEHYLVQGYREARDPSGIM